MLKFRAQCLAAVRSFFSTREYLEADTPALAPALIPESCLEVFRTDYLIPFRKGENAVKPLFLVPSPEVYLKRLIADHGVDVFQISKCYRNVESVGKIHSPEFTMLEYYTMQADYHDSLSLTESLIAYLSDTVCRESVFMDSKMVESLQPPFITLSMNAAFIRYAGFALAECDTSTKLAFHAAKLDLGTESDLALWSWDDLYELILVHTIEPNLPRNKPVFLIDYPARVPCLAAEHDENFATGAGEIITWKVKERWELYVHGVELANCYTEERTTERIKQYVESEMMAKKVSARIPHPPIENFGEICARMPPCSGVAMGLDRLIMILAGRSTLDSVLPFFLQP